MRLLAFAASNSSRSINRQLVDLAVDLLEDGVIDDIKVETIDLDDYEMPIYRDDRENESGIPKQAEDFFAAIGSADALLISFAEHNGLFTAAFKNVFDWASRIDRAVYQDKPIVMLATSPGPGGGANVLRTAVASAPHHGGRVLAQLSVPSFHDAVDPATGSLRDPELEAELRHVLGTLSAIDQPNGTEETSR